VVKQYIEQLILADEHLRHIYQTAKRKKSGKSGYIYISHEKCPICEQFLSQGMCEHGCVFSLFETRTFRGCHALKRIIAPDTKIKLLPSGAIFKSKVEFKEAYQKWQQFMMIFICCLAACDELKDFIKFIRNAP